MELQVGSILEGKVTSITKFGAFVALDNGKSGLVHISEIANTFVNDVHDYLQEGQAVKVLVLSTENGKVNLSIKRTLPRPERPARSPRPSGSHPAGTSRPVAQARPAARAQQPGLLFRQGQHRGLHPYAAGAAVQNGVNPAIHIVEHMPRCGGAGPSGQVSRGRGQGTSTGPDQPVCHRMGWKPHRYGGKAAAGFHRYQLGFGQNHGQRAGPISCSQFSRRLRELFDQGPRFLLRRDMDDQGIIRRPSLRRKNFPGYRAV